MIQDSIRWRLPLSYAGIALATTLVLGAVLLLRLRADYQRQEQAYLQNNAHTISSEIAPLLHDGLPIDALQSQLAGFAFLIQARIRLLDNDGQVLVDTGAMTGQGRVATLSVQVEAGGVSQAFSQTVTEDAPSVAYRSLIIVASESQATRRETSGEVIGAAALTAELPAIGSLYGFDLGQEQSDNPRSTQIVLEPIIHEFSGTTLGTVELSHGPAYGQAIVTNVAWGWGIASLVAVILATGIGWGASYRLTTPLLSLTTTTRQMAAGDLSARSPVKRRDELGLLSQAFNSMAGRVEEMVNTLRRFVADAAHELHTPLTALQTDLELIAADAPNAALTARVQRAQTQVTRLIQLTRNLLDLSHLEAPPQQQAWQPVDLTLLVQEIGELYASQAEQAGLSFTLVVPGQAVWISGQIHALRQALGNLLSNAVKFTPDGGKVHLALRAEAAQIVISVEDSGVGIKPEELPLLFERFHRGRNAAVYPGSGLGLAIVKAVAERHGGQVTATQMSPGMRFTLVIPSHHSGDDWARR